MGRAETISTSNWSFRLAGSRAVGIFREGTDVPERTMEVILLSLALKDTGLTFPQPSLLGKITGDFN